MNFDFTAEQIQIADTVGPVLGEGIWRRARSSGRTIPRFPFDVAQLMAKHGLMGITLPQSDRAHGGSLIDAVIAIEQVAAVCPRSADVVQFGNFGPIRTLPNMARRRKRRAGLTNCSPVGW